VNEYPSHFCMLESLRPRVTRDALVCPLIGELHKTDDEFPFVTMLAADRVYDKEYSRFAGWTRRLADRILASGTEAALRASHVVNAYELIWQGLYGQDTEIVKELIEYFGTFRRLHVLLYDQTANADIPQTVNHVVKLHVPEHSLQFFHGGEMAVAKSIPLEQIVGIYSRNPAIAMQQLAALDAEIAVLPFPDKANA
jgi:hypothetical protein